jgi:hypothetical protein
VNGAFSKTNTSGFVDYSTGLYHYIANAYPVLNKESSNSNKDSLYLKIGVQKTEKSGKSTIVAIENIKGTVT